jgi:hypothetical protein
MTLQAPRLESPSDFPSNGVPDGGYLEAPSEASSETARILEKMQPFQNIGAI